jgi:hypothetical protein
MNWLFFHVAAHWICEGNFHRKSVPSFTMKTAAVVSFLALLLSLHSCLAFLVCQSKRTFGCRLSQATEPEETSAAEAATGQDTEADFPISAVDAPAAETEENQEVKDEMIALKAEIAELETTLKTMRIKLASTTDKADDFSKAGYARKVAELEDMRRLSQVRVTSCSLGSSHYA